jgi:CRISPR-associated protein Csb3
VDLTNPGQFFACCGLLELADRLWPGTEGWFEERTFHLFAPAPASLKELVSAIHDAPLTPLEPEEPTTSPLLLGGPFQLRLDWWRDDRAGGSTFKTWAGQQKVVGIAKAMHRSLLRAIELDQRFLEFGEILPDPDDPKRSVAPFYFDARRAAGAHNLDIGFSNDAQKIETVSFPAVEFLCLAGLQRCRPGDLRQGAYVYYPWSRQTPLGPALASAVACGGVALPNTRPYGFRLLFRTKYLKGFLPAIPM